MNTHTYIYIYIYIVCEYVYIFCLLLSCSCFMTLVHISMNIKTLKDFLSFSFLLYFSSFSLCVVMTKERLLYDKLKWINQIAFQFIRFHSSFTRHFPFHSLLIILLVYSFSSTPWFPSIITVHLLWVYG